MTRFSIVLWILLSFSCNQPSSHDSKAHNGTVRTRESKLTGILLTETKLGNVELGKLDENNIYIEIQSKFPDFQVTKNLGNKMGLTTLLMK